MEKINKDNYDLLWKWGMSYLFMSIYLESGYKAVDSVSYNDLNSNYLFIAKESRKVLSQKTYDIFFSGFEVFIESLENTQKQLREYILEESSKRIENVSDADLLDGFQKMIKNLRLSWSSYFPIESHSFDLLTQKSKEGNKEIRRKIEVITPIRQAHRDLINHIMYSPGPYDKYVTEISKRLGYSIDYLTYTEVLENLHGKENSGIKNDYVITGLFCDWNPIVGKEAKKIFDSLLDTDKGLKEIKGMVGNKGFYIGKVRKIEFSLKTDFLEEINKMKNGEVLVSGSTGPEMILACKKAGAIVTEEGGLLNHAAIVSRELGIPCVVDTKIATSIFNTGDMVEVDANKGLVKRI